MEPFLRGQATNLLNTKKLYPKSKGWIFLEPDQSNQPDQQNQSNSGNQDVNDQQGDPIDNPIDNRKANHKGPTTAPTAPILPHVPPTADLTIDQHINPYTQIPPLQVPNEMLPATIVGQFVKIWNKESNYTGEPYDILDDKVRYFLDTCCTVGIGQTQFHAVFSSILSGRAKDYFVYNINRNWTFADMYNSMKMHFDTEVNKAQYHTDWTSLSYITLKAEGTMAGKSNLDVLQTLLDKLQLCQRALGSGYHGERQLIANTERACRGISELEFALFTPSSSFEDLSAKLRSSILTHDNRHGFGSINAQYFTDRRFGRRDRGDQYRASKIRFVSSRTNDDRTTNRYDKGGGSSKWKGKCFICGKDGCRTTKHTEEEQRRSKENWRRLRDFQGGKGKYNSFLIEYEGDSEEENNDQYHQDDDSDDDDAHTDMKHDASQYLMAAHLSNEAFIHLLTAGNRSDEFNQQFILDRYEDAVFQGIMPDTGAARFSTAGKSQFMALQKEMPTIKLDTNRANEAKICFGNGTPVSSIGTVLVDTPIGAINFHVVEAPTPFLLCVNDMDRLQVYLNNVTNEIIGPTTSVPVIRKWGHPWFFVSKENKMAAGMFLTEAELRRVHTRFGHPSVAKLHTLLTKAGHEVEREAIQMINKFCHYCQIKGDAPKRFKFTLKDDVDFNYELIIDIFYLDGKPVLHAVDAATSYQAGKFLKSMSAKDTWEALRLCWIDTYLGPPDIMTHDAGTNFDSSEFRAEAKLLGVTCHQIPVEAHWSIGKVEKYHGPLRRAYDIIRLETKGVISPESMLQMAFKAINDTAGPDGLVPTLLVFGAYPRINMDSPPSLSQQQRSQAVAKAMNELRKIKAQRSINDALNTRNGPDTMRMLPLSLELGSEVRIYREKKGWTGPYKVLSVTNADVTVNMENGPLAFRSTHVKPYNRHPDSNKHTESTPVEGPSDGYEDITATPDEAPAPFDYPEPVRPRRRGRPRKVHFNEEDGEQAENAAYMTHKERSDYDLAIKLRRDGIITTPGAPFEQSDAAEINSLLVDGVLEPIQYDSMKHDGTRLFKSRLVREVKGKTTSKPYEKSRLVVQGYNDAEKMAILTQAPTIQRCSQRLLLAITPALRKVGMQVMLRDITQAYTQSKTELNRTVLCKLPLELENRYPDGTILRVVKPLYGLAEAGNHWFATYSDHHKEKLGMETSSYDACLLITKKNGNGVFGITALQTDDTLNIGTKALLDKEEIEIDAAKFKARQRVMLETGTEGDFNGCHISIGKDAIEVIQKGQANKLAIVDIHSEDKQQRYVEQRARGAYIASICQPEATFDYSIAAQSKEPTNEDIACLNKRIQWQIDNKKRGIRFELIDLATAKLFVFVDGSFANNKDQSSQIGYVIGIGNEDPDDTTNKFTIAGNILHWSSTKCKRVTRSVLASEIYGMVSGFDLAYVINHTVTTICKQLGFPSMPLILCTDSYSLYQCLVQLGTTNEKRLMIDIMALRQSYEAREIDEIRWICGDDNPADAMTKASPNAALATWITTNRSIIRLEGWVKRKA